MQQAKAKTIQPKIATLVLLGIIFLAAIVALLWAAGVGQIADIFAYLNSLQQQPPMWVEAPMVMSRFLLAPTVFFFLIAIIITKVSPEPQTWSRAIVIAILLGLTIYYVSWRSLSTLNLSSPLNGTFSIALFSLEMFTLFNSSLQLFLMLRVKNRQREANSVSVQVIDGTFNPSVDILIPTYDEPAFILKRTIIGCQAIDYGNKTVYLLDDTRRPDIEQLAAELGCEYRTRPHNDHAKAGNLNYTIPHTKGEFIVIFDADFIPTKNFLHRTLGFFQDKTVALVQTPQSFYNVDPIARNLGLEDILTPEEEVFYRQLQPIKDGAGSVVCSGTSFLVRRKALESIGGFVTDSLSEDYFTGIRLSAKGYRLVYLDEKLSAGLAAENISAHATQRLRWARGTLQAFFIKSNPLTIPGLNILQRLAHLEGLLHWFTSIASVFFLLMPLAYAFLNIIPIRATTDEILYFFLPYYIIQITVFSWLNYRSRSAILSGIYGLVLAFPLALTVVQVILNPFSKGFKVTPKGTKSDRFNFNWKLALPLLVLFTFTAYSLWANLSACWIAEMNGEYTYSLEHVRGLGLGWIWSSYNLITIGAALLILLDVPKPDLNEWFNLRRTVKIKVKEITNQDFFGITTLISEVGADISLTQAEIPRLSKGETIPIELTILEDNIILSGQITNVSPCEDFLKAHIKFDPLTPEQQRQLVTLLFCRPGQWKKKNTPGELASVWLLFKILLRPKVLFDRNPQINAIKVAQI
ncbi:Glycosyl transferase family 2 [Hyella patelloides LEGE 07179]|uniref:Glycosyl transferase family 2 n=1 Tax=Hyella patelloides LEGE 07179 TaxID=945734 RepID=A0A563VW48_9CYAN|nr:glycosyltransferase family 2 protein [Hyella patelloides]VEP15483.1 Glycosyl transferase family 2 [Hyella patelloides LEGE 07179]